jgi:hypothetical protein
MSRFAPRLRQASAQDITTDDGANLDLFRAWTRYNGNVRGSPKLGRTLLSNPVIAEMKDPDNVSTAIPLA